MALGFGTTLGAATTDRVTSATEARGSQVSIHVWQNRNGLGGGNTGRIFDTNGGKWTLYNDSTTGLYTLGSVFQPYWRFTRPADNVWAPIGIALDTTGSSNDPVVFLSGSKLTVGSGLTQTGADAAYDNVTSPIVLGNRSSGDRNWDGMLAEFAMWNVILTDGEFAALAAGAAASSIQPSALTHYVELVTNGGDTKGASWTVTGTAVQSHPSGVPTAGGGGGTPFGSVKVSGAWKTVSAIQVNVGGTWKSVSAAKVNVSGTWKSLA